MSSWPWGEVRELHRFSLSEDAKTLTDESPFRSGAHVIQSRVVLERASAREEKEFADAFRRPEQRAVDGFKNIQVLKNIPNSALLPMMGQFQAALGVRCEFCHIPPAYESDEKPEKQKAREMINLVNDLNRQSSQPVSCLSCHHGSIQPAID